MADPLTAEEFLEFARDPQSHTVDGEQTVSRSADDIIKLNNAAGATDAAGTGTGLAALRPARVIHPGAGPE